MVVLKAPGAKTLNPFYAHFHAIDSRFYNNSGVFSLLSLCKRIASVFFCFCKAELSKEFAEGNYEFGG